MIKGIKVETDCSNLNDLPTINFSMDGQVYPLEGKDYVLEVSQFGQKECILGIQSLDLPAGFNYLIMGDVFIRKYPCKFDYNDNTVTFLKSKAVEKTLA
jgi:hypothetical protein